MDAFIYSADLFCSDCTTTIKQEIAHRYPQHVPVNPQDECSYDSDRYPKGPYMDGGGESDSPQHCGRCGLFLENPLTRDGYRYVEDKLRRDGDSPTVQEWADFYGISGDVILTES